MIWLENLSCLCFLVTWQSHFGSAVLRLGLLGASTSLQGGDGGGRFNFQAGTGQPQGRGVGGFAAGLWQSQFAHSVLVLQDFGSGDGVRGVLQ